MKNKQFDEGEASRDLEDERDEQISPCDDEKVFKLFLKVAKKYEVIKPWLLKYLSREGESVKLNGQEAIKRFLQAADQCSATNHEAIEDLYFTGSGVEEDFQEALRWAVKEIVFKGHQWHLEEGDHKDEGGDEDGIDILNSYRAVSEKDADYKSAFGDMYCDGNLVKREKNEVIQMYRKAASETSCGEYDMRLGDIYREGELVEQDMKMACKWYGEAARKGEVQAIPYLEEHFKKSLKKMGGL